MCTALAGLRASANYLHVARIPACNLVQTLVHHDPCTPPLARITLALQVSHFPVNVCPLLHAVPVKNSKQ